ncbi:glucosaminidase domain-containing protein, partial [Candidatus Saccharibacteria bacterium]|nr:glucosaminidase domain-containing protein [Candidatus Saccharibacteria bacterium]
MALLHKRAQKILYIIAVVIFSLVPTSSIQALSEARIRWYDSNQIMFYNPEEGCVPSGGTVTENPTAPGATGGNTTFVSEGNEHGHWEGGCSGMGSYDDFLRKYNGPIRTAAARNGVPWEAMISQMIIESGGGVHEVCANNPLGLKGEPSCDGQHRIFSSHEEAFNYYFSSIIPVKRSAGRFSQNPYSYIEFIEYGDPNAVYAEDSQYVTKVSDIICGVQKWAQANGIPISAETYSNFKSPAMGGSGTTQENPSEESTTPETPTTPTPIVVSVPATNTCPSENGENGESEGPFVPESGELISGGMNFEQAKAFMDVYRNIRPRTYAEPGGEILDKWKINRVDIDKTTNDCWSNLENCVAVVQWFICEYG